MKKANKIVTESDIEYIKENFGKIFVKDIAKNLDWSTAKLERLARKLGLKSKLGGLRCNANMDLIKSMSSPEIIYILGYLWADGCLPVQIGRQGDSAHSTVRLNIAEEDFRDIENIIRLWGKAGKYRDKRERNGNKCKPCIAWVLSDVRLTKFLIKFDYLLKSEASTEKILSAIPENLRHYWWRGYFDGDGCLHLSKDKVRAVSLSIAGSYNQNWLFSVSEMNRIGCNFNIRKRIGKNGSSSTMSLTGNKNILRFLNYIYQGDISFCLKRKFNKFLIAKSYIPRTSLISDSHITFSKGKWLFQVTRNKKRLIFKTFKTKENAIEFKIQFMKDNPDI